MCHISVQKEVERFKRLLRSAETVKELDRISSVKNAKQLTWDAVFRCPLHTIDSHNHLNDFCLLLLQYITQLTLLADVLGVFFCTFCDVHISNVCI